MTTDGYDISKWQTETPDLTGVGFVIVRACYGSSEDTRYTQHAANVRAAGKVLGAYLFARPVTTGDTVEAQVEAFLRVAADADIIAIDREKDGDAGTITATDTRLMIRLIQATGRRVGLYASESAFRDYGQDWSWVANWSHEPAIPWDVWQWEGGGTDHLDNDRFRGTTDALLALGAPLEGWVDARVSALEGELATAQQALDASNATNQALVQQVTGLLDTNTTLAASLLEARDERDAAESKITAATTVLAEEPAVRAVRILVDDEAARIERLADVEGSPLP